MKLLRLHDQAFFHFAFAFLLVVSQFASATAAEHPNVVLIFADDLGYGDVGCFYGDCPFQTPHLDQMAREGARLTNFYVPTPFCAPSRGTILTGRYPFRHTVVRNPAPDVGASNFGLPHSEITIAELLKTAGYATAAFGKWHLGHKPPWLPRTQGFDKYFGILYSNDMYPVQLVQNEEVAEYPVPQSTLTARYTERTLQFIEQHSEQPFFVYLAHAMPHKPLAASDDFYTPNTRDDLYADVIAELDDSVGQILSKLKELNLDEKTLVIFTSDNGPWYGGTTGGLRGMKGRTWEGGLRVPLIARLPTVIEPSVVNEYPAASIDILPTVCKLAGVPIPTDRIIDGRNILPMLQDNGASSPHDAIFSMKGERLATIRSGRWKLHVENPGSERLLNWTDDRLVHWIDPRGPDGVTILAPFEQSRPTKYPGLMAGDRPRRMMLFDLETDPGEQHNLADAKPEVVAKLKKLFDETARNMPEFSQPKSDYLFQSPQPGNPRRLMRLIGGDLRYDRVPKSQQHLLIEERNAAP